MTQVLPRLATAFLRSNRHGNLVSAARLSIDRIHHTGRFSCALQQLPQPSYSFTRSLRISSNRGAVENPSSQQTEKVKTAEHTATKDETAAETAAPKPSLFQRFKQMYKDYWYVLIPVHLVTSAGWVTVFYLSVKNGLDVVALLESLNVSERIVQPLRSSSVGYYALTYALYKVASPVRYAVTIGGTTVSINYLTRWGLIKPVPSKADMKLMYQNRKDRFNTQREELRRKLRQHRAELRRKVSLKSAKRANKK